MGPDTSRRLFPLTSCSIGLWSPVEGMRPFLLLCPDRKQFVMLLAREPDKKANSSSGGSLSVNAVLACARNYAALWLRHKNPFIDHTQEPAGDSAVLTFEVSFSNVVGMDFRWPLTEEPRLVLEAACLCKRVFDSVDDVCSYYPPVRHRSLRSAAAAAASAAHAGAAATAGEQSNEQQPLHLKQQHQHYQQQQKDSDAASTVGMISRVPSWASWASWTIGSTRASLEYGNLAALAPAAAVHEAAPAEHGAHSAHAAPAAASEEGVHALHGIAGMQCAGDAVLGALSDHQHAGHCCPAQLTPQQEQHEAGLSCNCWGHHSSSSGGGGSPDCTLDSMVSLSMGMAGSASQAAAAAAVDAVPATAADESSNQLQQLLEGRSQPPASSRHAGSPGSAELLAAADIRPLLLRRRQAGATPGISPAVSGPSTPHGGISAASDSGLSEHAALLEGALTEASFGFWQQHPGQQLGLQDSTSGSGSGQHRQPVDATMQQQQQLLRLGRHGAATAPCSATSSPRHAQGSLQCSSPTAASDASRTGQSLTKFDLQPQELQLAQHRSRAAARGSGASSRRTSKSRLAAAADATSCPLCHQTLTQPHAVLQQRFHQRLDHKHVRLAAAAAAAPHGSSKSSKAGGMAARSRSACSLQQLQQIQQQERAGSEGGSSSVPALDVQQHVGSAGDRGDRSPLSPRSFAGLAAAAIGVLAARCKPGSGSGSGAGVNNKPGQRLHLQRAHTGGASEVCATDSAFAAAAATAAVGEDGGVEAVAKGQAKAVQAEQLQQYEAAAVTAAANANAVAASSSATSTQGSDVAVAAIGSTSRQPCSTCAANSGDASGGVLAGSATTHGPADILCAADAEVPCTADASARVSLGDKAAAATPAPAAAAAAAAADTAATAAPAAASTSAEKEGPNCQTMLYGNRTVVLTFSDPTLPYQLSKLVKNPSNVHLLKLYESGLPAWAVVLPSYGLWYRPWLRKVTWLLFVLLSVVSMAMGFYDLWKNVPYFKQFVVRMFRPAAAVFEWLEGHTQIRLSILLTYMVGKSQLLVQLIKLLTDASLQPLLAPFAPLAAFVSALYQGISWLLQPFVDAAQFIFGPIGRLVWVLVQLLWRLVSTLLWFGPLQLLQLLGSGVLGVFQLLLWPLEALLPAGASIRAGWTAARATGQVARNAAPVVAEAARTAAGSGAWWWWSPLEALELMRVSTVRVAKALQAVLRFFVTLASTINKHRLSLMMQLKGKVWGGLQAAAASPAGRVATIVADRMGQGDRLRRVHQRVARKLHGQDSLHSLNSMGSDALAAMGVYSPAAADGYAYRPYSRAFSIDGESELLLESPHERADSEDDEVSSSSSAVRAWQHTLATQPGVGVLQTPPARRSLRSSLTTGLRHRAVTAAAAAAAAAAGEVGAGSVGIMREQVGDGLTLQPIGGAPVSSFSLAAAGITPGNVQEGVPTGGMLAAALAGNGGLAAATEPGGLRFSSSQDSILAAAAARAALSRSYHLPAGSFKSSQDAAAAAAAAVAAVNIAVCGTRQSCDSFTTAPAAAVAGGSEVFLRPGQQAPGAWVSAGGALVAAAAEQQLRGPQLQQGGQGSGSCSGAALVTEAAGLLMLPQGRSL